MIKKPGILSDEEWLKSLVHIILKGSPVTLHSRDRMDSVHATKIAKEILGKFQAQNDYCYKEMLGQFVKWLDEHLSDPAEMELYNFREQLTRSLLESDYQALQGLEEG